MIENTIKVMRKSDGRVYDAFVQAYSNMVGEYILRWNIGINGYNAWTFVCAVYDNDKFNNDYQVVKYSKRKKCYIPEIEYRQWIDDRGE